MATKSASGEQLADELPLTTVLHASSLEKYASGDDDLPENLSSPGLAKLRPPLFSRHRRRLHKSQRYASLVAVCLLSVLTAASLCVWFRLRRGATGQGMQLRQLAVSASDLDDELDTEALCAEFGHWDPPTPHQDGTRASPDAYQLYFEQLERELEPSAIPEVLVTPQTAASSPKLHFRAKRAADPHQNEHEEASSPKMAAVRLAEEHAVPDSEAASTSQAESRYALSSDQLTAAVVEKHCYVRIPKMVVNDMHRKFFNPEVLKYASKTSHALPDLLMLIRTLLLEKTLYTPEVNQLVQQAERVAAFAVARMNTEVAHLSPGKAVRALGRRFMAINALYSISLVDSESMQMELWWTAFLQRIPSKYDREVRVSLTRGPHLTLARDLSKALQQYKDGKRPSDDDVVKLKLRLFDPWSGLAEYSSWRWDPWRLDGYPFWMREN